MTIESEHPLEKLRTVGWLVVRTFAAMGKALEAGGPLQHRCAQYRPGPERQLH